jgi:RNA polymerase sigma-70 factor (ECF subfamily)
VKEARATSIPPDNRRWARSPVPVNPIGLIWPVPCNVCAMITQEREVQFMSLLAPHLKAVRRLVHSMARNDFDAEDILQQTLLQAFAHLHQFRFEASFKTWLMKIAINESRQNYRKSRAGRTSVVEQKVLDGLQVADEGESPQNLCQRKEICERLHRAISRLPRIYRTVVELRDMNELSVVETALRLNLATSTVKTRHRRARLWLLRNLAPAYTVPHAHQSGRALPRTGSL